jgi:hypothetical protein
MSNDDALFDSAGLREEVNEADLNAPVEWTGLPAFHPAPKREHQLVLTFEDPAKRDDVVRQLGLVIAKKTGPTWSAWYPPRPREDLAALRFDVENDDAFGDQ